MYWIFFVFLSSPGNNPGALNYQFIYIHEKNKQDFKFCGFVNNNQIIKSHIAPAA